MPARSDTPDADDVALHVHDAVEWREIAGAVVIRTRDGEELMELNASGSHLFRSIAEDHTTPADLARELMAEFEIDIDQATDDANSFVSALRKLGLLA